MSNAYDEGYAACPCFWGREPGSLVSELQNLIPSFRGLRVLDLGCGEGKNAGFLAARGALVEAIDSSELALANARSAWPSAENIDWRLADIRHTPFLTEVYDIVIAYGVLHCLTTEAEVRETVGRLKAATVGGGFNVLCSFNSRAQDLSAHPGFSPTLLAHQDYEQMYSDWRILVSSDTDLHETHPHNQIRHTHAMTRLIATKTQS